MITMYIFNLFKISPQVILFLLQVLLCRLIRTYTFLQIPKIILYNELYYNMRNVCLSCPDYLMAQFKFII
jgi:hypothetical protein